MNPAIENILTRRSVRSFRADQIAKEELDAILLAGSYAPSSLGEQSWLFTAVLNPETLRAVNEAIRQALLILPIEPDTYPYTVSLVEKAKTRGVDANFLFHAPAYIIVSNRADNKNAMADSALALENMMLAAHSLGIGSCWLNQIAQLTHLAPIREIMDTLKIPKDHLVYGSMVLGYPAKEPRPAAPRKDVIRIIG